MNLTQGNAGNFGKHLSSSRENTMNISTIGNSKSSNWKRIRGQYVASAAGIALAVSAVVTFGSSELSSPAPVQPQHAVAPAALNASPITVRAVSRADIDAAVLSTDMATYDFGGVQPAVSKNTFEAERSAFVTLQEQFIVGQMERTVASADVAASVLSTELASYAVPAPQPVSAAAIDAERSALVTLQEQFIVGQMERTVAPADIAASVLSTELANFAVPAERVASEADIKAGVLSSELAHFGNVEAPAQQAALIAAFSAEHVELLSLHEQILVALSGASVSARQPSAADIAVGVISTELAHFGN